MVHPRHSDLHRSNKSAGGCEGVAACFGIAGVLEKTHTRFFDNCKTPYDLLWKGAGWKWTPLYNEALQLLIFEATTHQALGAICPTDPVRIQWGFVNSGLSRHMWQRELDGPTRPIGFYSCSFKDAKK